MELLAQPGQALRPGEQDLRRGEALAGGQGPAEALVAGAQHRPDGAELLPLHLGPEAAGPEVHQTDALAVVLGGLPVAEDQEGIVLVAGHAPAGADGLDAVHHGQALGLPLQAVAAVEVQQIPAAEGQLQADGAGLFQHDGLRAAVFIDCGPGDHVPLREDAVEQPDRQGRDRVPEGDLQGLCAAVRVPGGGQAGQAVFPRPDLVADVAQLRAAAAVGVLDPQAGDAEISDAAGAELLADRIQGIGAVAAGPVGAAGEAAVIAAVQLPQVLPADLSSVVDVAQAAISVDRHLVFGLRRLDGDGFGCFVVSNTHV